MLVDPDADEVYLGELNPRISGASSITNVTAGAYSDMPLFLFHLLEYMGVDYELDVDEINERWEDLASVDLWSQMIIKETAPTRRAASPRRRGPASGTSTTPATLRFRRAALDWHQLQNENECFFLRIYGAGRLPLEGRRSRRAGDQGPVADRRTTADRALPSAHRGDAGTVRELTRRQAAPSRSDQLPEGIVVLTRRRLLSFPPTGSGRAVQDLPHQLHRCVRVQEREPADRLALPLGRRDEGDLLVVQRLRPRVVVRRLPAEPAEQHDAEVGLADQLQVRGRLDQVAVSWASAPPPRSPRGRRPRP